MGQRKVQKGEEKRQECMPAESVSDTDSVAGECLQTDGNKDANQSTSDTPVGQDLMQLPDAPIPD